ncbi:MAG: molybdopterin biosynthesis protein MoeB [Proteobacteria bacterium]|nr:molybdopterin biosynthesis protein MoeB [Pseudomonadota bacterium]
MNRTVRDLVAAARARVREIGPRELAAFREAGVPIIDVREPDEFAEGHIPGAVNIPRGLLEFEVDGHPAVAYRTAEELSHRERPVVLYCLSGGRSALAAAALQTLGFVSPLSLAGGILNWEDAGQPMATPAMPRAHATRDAQLAPG